MKHIAIAILLGLFVTSFAQADVLAAPDYLKTKIEKYAAEYQVSPDVMTTVVRCESGFKPTILGDEGQSRGLVQINKYWHSEITDAQAFDPDFALDFLASYLALGRGSQWTCWRMFYGNHLAIGT